MATEQTELDAKPGEEEQIDEQQGAEDDGAPGPYDELARDMGWVGKDQFQGDPDQWKPAEDFIRAGRDIQRQSNAELKALRHQMDTIARTTGTIVEQTVNERVEKLTADYNRLVEDGDATGAFKVAGEINALKTPPHNPAGPPPEAQSFAERNKSWFQKDPLATAEAIEITNRLAAQGYDPQTQLETAEKEIKRRYPHLFTGQLNGKRPAGVNEPGSRGPRGGTQNRVKGFADLPPEAQKIGADLAERGVIKADTPAAAKEAYAKQYWTNEAATASRGRR